MNISYSKGASLFHRIDPLTKVVWSLLISIWLLSTTDLATVSLITLLVVSTSELLAKINLKIFLKASVALAIGGVGLTLFQAVFRNGPGIIVGPVTLSYEGITIGIALTVRAIGIVASCLAFSTTTKPSEFSNLLIRLGLNYQIAHIVYLSLRFIPLFEEDAKNIIYSQRLRGVKKGLSRFTRTIVTFLLTELRHADETAIALEMRGFGLQEKKTILEEVGISKVGTFIVIMTLLAMLTHLLISIYV